MNPDPASQLPWGLLAVLLAASLCAGAIGSMAERSLMTGNKSKFRSQDQFALRGMTLFCEFAALLLCYALFRAPLAALADSLDLPEPLLLADLALLLIAGYAILVLGDLLPGKWAAQRGDKAARFAQPVAKVLMIPLKPFLWVVHQTVNVLLRMTGQKVHLEDEDFSEEEVMSLLETGQEKGALKEEGKKMIDSIFAFDDKFAYEIMTPRTEVFAIDINDPPSKYVDELMELKYSRIPVYDDDSDNIIGILHIKDYLIKARETGFDNVDLAAILRKPFFVPDTKYIDTLFFELQKTRQHIAVLIDEYGGFSGIVTLEDIIEEVMGNIDDEYDEEIPKIESLGNQTFRIDGTLYLDDINEQLGTDFYSENIETLGGLLIEILGEIPEEGTQETRVQSGRYEFTVESVRDRRIETVRLRIRDDETPGREPANPDEKDPS